VTSEERRESLADQAAAWVPPWARATASESVDGDSADGVADTVVEPPGAVAEPEEPPGAVAEPEAVEDAPEAVEEPEAVRAGPERVGDRYGAAEDPPMPGEPDRPGVPVPQPADRAPEPAGYAPDEAPPPRGGGARAVSTLALVDDDELHGALEAILLVVDEPVAELVLARVLEQPVERVGAALEKIARGYTEAGHGFELRRAAGGWRLYTRPEYAGYVERFVLDGQSVRLTQAALETLAVVAYKQPVTRSRISAIRGVNCDGVIRTLVSRGLVEECGTEPDSGAHLYRTTTLFLEKLGLDRVDELPPLAPFLPDDVEEMTDAPR
jgi:segregation and condensation protein B